MRQRAGVYFTDQADNFIERNKIGGHTVKLFSIGGEPACTNCLGNNGMMIVYSSGGDRPNDVSFDGAWHKGNLYAFACPICNDDSADRLAYLWHHSGLFDLEQDYHLDFIEGLAGKERALQVGRDLLALTPSPEGWYTLRGSYGVGKSGLMKSIVAGFIRAGVEARYIRAEDILTEIRATFSDNDSTEHEVIQRYSNLRVLAVDEVGADRMSTTQWAQAKLMTILDNRYRSRNRLATLIATNDSGDDLERDYGYLASRMKDGKRIVMGGIELRGRMSGAAA